MSFSDYPDLPTAWPNRTQDRDTFNQAAADAFAHYDELPAFYTSLKSAINSATAALVASNLPTLTTHANKAVFVNSAGTDVELSSIIEYDQGTATGLGKVGDFTAGTYADALTGSLSLSWPATVLVIGIGRVQATASSQQFRLRCRFTASAIATSPMASTISTSGGEEIGVAVGVATAGSGGTYGFALESSCSTNAEVNRATAIAIALRSP